MHKIYFEKRCLTICSEQEHVLADPNSIEVHIGEDSEIAPIIKMIETTGTLAKIMVPSVDVESTYKTFCSHFKEVNAAGGLVSNRSGDLLLIRRNGLWDLPKGHQEAGEDIKITAIREVQEETGVNDLELKDLICVTDHCYFRNEMWHLKHTWWFNMLYTDPVDLRPQREEDISKAAWVARSSMAPYIKETYPSIAEVLREAKI